MRFAFGDRIRARSERLRLERWQRYLEYLKTSHIDLTNAATMALVGDVLHDSPITLQVDSRTGDAILSGRNLFRIDRESKAGRVATAPLSLRFCDCQQVTLRQVGEDATYYQAELHERGDSRLEVRIAMKPLKPGFGWIVIESATVHVEAPNSLEAGLDFPSRAAIERASRT